MVGLSRFILKTTDKCTSFFDVLKVGKRNFAWTQECKDAFQVLVDHLERPLVLLKPLEGEDLLLYLAVFVHASSAALAREETKIQRLVYYINK